MIKWINRILCSHQVRKTQRIPNHNNGEVFSMIEINTCIHCGKVTKKEF